MTARLLDSSTCTIARQLQAQAERTPGAAAIGGIGRVPLSYGGLWVQVEQTVETFNSFGLGRSDRIAMVLPNGPEMAVAFLAAAACGSAAPLNPAYTASEFDFCLSDLRARALIVLAGQDSPARTVARERCIPVIELSPAPELEAGIFWLRGEKHACRAPAAPPEPDDTALLLHTSGTSSRPKLVPLSQRNVCATARNHVRVLALGEADRCLDVMPLFHVHGLTCALLGSLFAGGSVVCCPGFYASDFFTWIDVCQPTWYTASPTVHQLVLAHAPRNRDIVVRRPLRFIRSASSPLPPTVMAELERIFAVPVLESYGMTEVSPIFHNPLPPGTRKAGSAGIATGVEVGVLDAAGAVVSPGEIGEIVVRGDSVMAGYEGNPEANARAFLNGWLRTGDQGLLDAEGYVFVKGRIKEVIDRGGEKISPREIDEVLLQHPAVAEAVAFAVPSAQFNEEVAAAVVLRANAAATEDEIRDFAFKRLAHFKVPTHIFMLDALPKTPTGKVLRIGLAERLGLTRRPRQATAPLTPPRTELERQLADLWANVLGVAKVGVYDDFLELGGDSILASQLLVRIGEMLHEELSLAQFFQARTVAAIALSIVQRRAEKLDHKEVAATLARLEAMSDDEAQLHLSAQVPNSALDGGNKANR